MRHVIFQAPKSRNGRIFLIIAYILGGCLSRYLSERDLLAAINSYQIPSERDS
jgi:hypothetical protein